MGPLLTLKVHEALRAATRAGVSVVECSLDLERSTTKIEVDAAGWWLRCTLPPPTRTPSACAGHMLAAVRAAPG